MSNTLGRYWSWSQEPNSIGTVYPQSRQGHTICYSQSLHSLVMFGGRSTNPTNDIFLYSISTLKWSRIKCSGNVPSTVSYHNSIILRNPINSEEIMVVIGGLKDTDISSNEILALSLAKWKWTSLKFYERFPPRHHASICIVNDKLTIFGGTQKPELKSFNDLWTIDLRSLMSGNGEIELKSWAAKGSVPEKRYGHISFSNERNAMVAWGHLDSQRSDPRIYSYSFSKQEWSSFSPNGVDVKPRCYCSYLQLSPVQTIIFGGETVKDQLYLQQSYIYNNQGNLWISPFFVSSRPIPRKHQSACILPQSQTIYMIGGLNKQFCSMQIACLRLKEHQNNLKWVKNKELNSVGKAALRIVKKSIESNYHQISLLEKFLKEENHELKALNIMYESLENKRNVEVKRIEEENREKEKVIGEMKKREEVEMGHNQGREELLGKEGELREVMQKRVGEQEVYLLNLIQQIKQMESKKMRSFEKGLVGQGEHIIDELLQFYQRIDPYL